MITGSAPISPKIIKFFRSTLSCNIREVYGQTETTGAAFITGENEQDYGHVGGPNMGI